ncbi:hypothetical protein ACIGBL_33980 [Streptomyces sp. NPDC085614]|uniref:hypothetical protein n=1 Tax=Streptomyces sp. NPDC085614 TaxID=3365733 RepID=UPI0037D01F66
MARPRGAGRGLMGGVGGHLAGSARVCFRGCGWLLVGRAALGPRVAMRDQATHDEIAVPSGVPSAMLTLWVDGSAGSGSGLQAVSVMALSVAAATTAAAGHLRERGSPW